MFEEELNKEVKNEQKDRPLTLYDLDEELKITLKNV